MKILVAKSAGYCFGVRDAVKIAYETSKNEGDVYMLGTIVHNERVVDDLSNAGAKVVESLDEVPKDKSILFRAHGTAPDVWDEAKEKNMKVVDATCPLVIEIHDEIKELEREGRRTIIIGDHGHDEVVGIASQVKKPIIIASKEEAKALKKMKKAGVVSQSTQMIENVQEIINILTTKVYDLRFVNTICYPTRRNHQQIKELADKCDIMVVIGSFTSANSKRLTQIALEKNKKSYQVTSAVELKKSWFEGCKTIGVSAGASTPDDTIEEVVAQLKLYCKKLEKEVTYG